MTRDPFEKKKIQTPAPASGWSQPAGAVWGDSADEPKADRAEPESHSYLDKIPTADWQPKKRKKDTRKRDKARKLSLLPKNKQSVEKHAAALNVPKYEIARYLLEYGMDAVLKGDMVLESHLTPTGLTLYPAKQSKYRKHRRTMHSALKVSTYRGIPDDTWEQLKALEPNYPFWQVINKLIEYGLAQLESGILKPDTQPTGALTLYKI